MPGTLLSRFRAIAFAATTLTLLLMHDVARLLGASPSKRWLAVFLHGGVFWTLKFSFYSAGYIDDVTSLFLLLVIHTTLTERYRVAAMVLCVSVFQKESPPLFGVFPVVESLRRDGAAPPDARARCTVSAGSTLADRDTLQFDFTSPPKPEPSSPGGPGDGRSGRGPGGEGPRALSVSQLDRAIRESLEASFETPVWVEGEVTGARPAPSGHVYFCLKDEKDDASIDAVIYRASLTARGKALLKDGARVKLRGRPSFYAPRGRLQLVADKVEAVGRGAILEALERLKEKLTAEGLFATERKRALPKDPRVIGVVTSPTGAVIHDVIKVAFRRGGARILLAPARVQGDGAAESILRALRAIQKVAEVDVVIVGRGGGSTDDLLAFSDEMLVRAVAACRVPVVSAVGHEVDFTLVDFAADARAATPSQAAEMLVPDRSARGAALRQTHARLVQAMRARIRDERAGLERFHRKLGDPRLAIQAQQQRLDERVERLAAWSRAAIGVRRDRLARLGQALHVRHPRLVIARERSAIDRATDAMKGAMRRQLERRRAVLERAGTGLDALSPLRVLGRGYAIATRADGRAIRSAADVKRGDRISLRVESARIEADVMDVAATDREDDIDEANR